MNYIFGLVAFVGFILSLVVHLSALIGIDVSARFPFVWLLHIGIFVVFFPFVFASRKTLGARPTLAEIRAAFPTWAVVAGACVFAYAVVNFTLVVVGTERGTLEIRDGNICYSVMACLFVNLLSLNTLDSARM